MKKLILLVVATSVLLSCFPAYKIQPKEDRFYKLEDTYAKPKVYVINSDSLKREFKILKHSKLYEFTDDSKHETKIKLYPLQRTSPFCGNGMILSTITIGVLPTEFPDTYNYKFDIIESNNIEQKIIRLNVSNSLWLLNIFSNKKNFKKQIGIALRAQIDKSK